MPLVKLVMAFQILESFMISVNYKLFRHKMVFPSMKSSHKSIQLFVVDGVITRRAIDFFTEVSNWMAFLQ